MKAAKKWQMVVIAGLGLLLIQVAGARADFAFGKPVNLGSRVNSPYPEYDPDISADGLSLYFQSDRPDGYGDSDLYVATRETIHDEWGQAVNLGPYINTAARELGPNLSADGLSLYFSSTRDGGFGGNDLYVATRESLSDPWGTPVNLGPVVNSVVDDVSPCLSADGLSLYFSDWDQTGVPARPGGVGQADLWVSRRTSLSTPWTTPVNLGRTVNCSDIEGAPDVSHDGLMLFFSGYRNGGSWDLWVCMQNTATGQWETPVNLGPAVNSKTVDLNPSVSADGRMLYFVSFRSGSDSDLWQVPITPIVDFNGDGQVNETEIGALVDHWGQNEPVYDIGPAPCGDGIVDARDLLVLAEYVSKEIDDPTLLACWKFDETEGDTACDSTGASNGNLRGSPVWQPAGGAANGAIELDGIDDYVVAALGPNSCKGPFSVFVWVKGGGPGQTILSQRTGDNWLKADTASGTLTTDLRSAGRFGRSLGSYTLITDGNWHRIGLVWDGMYRTLYVDDNPVAEDTQSDLQSAYGDLHIGSSESLAPGSFWSGLIDDVRIYDRIVKP